MKRVFNRQIFATLLIGVVALFAQSCEKETTATVPGAQEIECKAGDNPSLSFTAGDKWEISSDAIWCKFVTSAGELQNMAGGAGSHTITLKITDDNNGSSWSTAKITMKMGGQTGIIATVKRHPKELYMKVNDVAENPKKSLEIGYIDYKPWYIEANFRFAAVEIPEWVEVKQINEETYEETYGSITGAPGQRSYVMLRIVTDGYRERYPITEEDGHVIKFQGEDGNGEFEVPITYAGMGKNALTFVGPTEKNYGWEVSLDGKEFRQHNEENGSTVKFSNELAFDIAAQNDEFDILYLEKSINRGILEYKHIGTNDYNKVDEAKSWMHFDKEAMTLTIDEGTTTRYGLVMALPRGIYNIIRADVEKYILDVDGASGIDLPIIDQEYEKFVLIELTQRDFAEQQPYEGMYIYHSLTTLEIPAKEYTNAATMAEYGVDTAYECPFVNSIEGKRPGIVIDPRTENWTTAMYEEGNATVEIFHNGKSLKMSDDEYYLGENKDENMAVYLWGPKDGWQGKSAYILFKVNGEAKKLLVVTPPAK